MQCAEIGHPHFPNQSSWYDLAVQMHLSVLPCHACHVAWDVRLASKHVFVHTCVHVWPARSTKGQMAFPAWHVRNHICHAACIVWIAMPSKDARGLLPRPPPRGLLPTSFLEASFLGLLPRGLLLRKGRAVPLRRYCRHSACMTLYSSVF